MHVSSVDVRAETTLPEILPKCTSRFFEWLQPMIDQVRRGVEAAAAIAPPNEAIDDEMREVQRGTKVVESGSRYLIAANRLVSGVIDPGSLTSRSEPTTVAHHIVDPNFGAIDVTVTHSQDLAGKIAALLPQLWQKAASQPAELSQAVPRCFRDGIFVTRDPRQSIDFVNPYASEHLEVIVEEPLRVLGGFHNAAEILLRPTTPILIDNFVLGPDHVLPTGGHPRRHSHSAHDDIERASIDRLTSKAYDELARDPSSFAGYEGFDDGPLCIGLARAAQSFIMEGLANVAETELP